MGRIRERLVEFWEYLSTKSLVEDTPYFMDYWNSWRTLDSLLLQGSLPEDILPPRNLF